MNTTSNTHTGKTIMRQQLRAIVPLADSTICDMARRGEFPQRFYLTSRCVVRDLAEVEACSTLDAAPQGLIRNGGNWRAAEGHRAWHDADRLQWQKPGKQITGRNFEVRGPESDYRGPLRVSRSLALPIKVPATCRRRAVGSLP
jgi:predicted DNA-binding transcriptional regulator AlpA